MSFHLGLTGSIGTGKTATARLFADEGCPVWDADAAVHRLYARNGAAFDAVAQLVPDAAAATEIDRGILRAAIQKNASLLAELEAIVHPLVRVDRLAFRARVTAPVVVYDIPLLYETGSEHEFDAVACVWVDPDTQMARILERGTMTEAQARGIIAKQLPMDEKRRRAQYEIQTDTPEHALQQVRAILQDIRTGAHDA